MKLLKLPLSFLLIFFIVSYSVSNAQIVELFGVASNECFSEGATGSSLFRVNPDTAEVELIGDIGFDGVTGLAFLPDERLVGSARDDIEGDVDPIRRAILININPGTGAGSLIGLIGDESVDGECGRAPDLSYDPLTNTLFATGTACPRPNFLQTVNTISGQGTLVGNYDPFTGGGNGFAISNDRVFFVATLQTFAKLITIDPSSGAPTLIATLTLDRAVFVNALAFHPVTGELFGSTANVRSSTLIKINTQTGVTTEVGALPDCFDAIIFKELPPRNVPTLSEWGLIAMAGILGIIGILAIRRRKVTA